eukprot:EG_transcript_25733
MQPQRSAALVQVTSLGQLGRVLEWWPEALAAHLPVPDLVRWSLCGHSSCLTHRRVTLEQLWDLQVDGVYHWVSGPTALFLRVVEVVRRHVASFSERWHTLPLSRAACLVMLSFEWRVSPASYSTLLWVESGDEELMADCTLRSEAVVDPAQDHWNCSHLVFRPRGRAETYSLWVIANCRVAGCLTIRNLVVREIVSDTLPPPDAGPVSPAPLRPLPAPPL